MAYLSRGLLVAALFHYLKNQVGGKGRTLVVQRMNTGQSPRLSSKSTKRSVAARTNGSYGGQERALRYEQVILSEWGSRGGKAVLAKYGPEYFKELRKRRKPWTYL